MSDLFFGRIFRNRTINASIGLLLVFSLIAFGLPSTYAQETERSSADTAAKLPIEKGPLRKINEYFSTQTITYADGTSLERIDINGPPDPPPGYEFERTPVLLPKPDKQMGIKTLTVPAYNWVFGCSSVSGAMIAGFYDRNGYANMYTGPTNGGMIPMNNSSWPTWSDGYRTYPNLPLAASHQGVDGRTTRGSIDDYWVKYLSTAQDPYISGGWSQHTWSDAIGDYMKTSQSAYSNVDGSTSFYTWISSPSKLTCSDMVSHNIHTRDGTYGRKFFYEARGYTVTDCYNQKTDNNGGGFTFANYKSEIDAGRPVMLNVEGHTMVGVGYNDAGNLVYLHDTWDYNNHTMTWGGSYSGMALQSVSIVNLTRSPTPQAPPPLVHLPLLLSGCTEAMAVGNWNITFDWFCDGILVGSGGFTIRSDHTFSDPSGSSGTWTMSGNEIVLTYSNGTVYRGTFNDTCTAIQGNMVDYYGNSGCWHTTNGSSMVPSFNALSVGSQDKAPRNGE